MCTCDCNYSSKGVTNPPKNMIPELSQHKKVLSQEVLQRSFAFTTRDVTHLLLAFCFSFEAKNAITPNEKTTRNNCGTSTSANITSSITPLQLVGLGQQLCTHTHDAHAHIKYRNMRYTQITTTNQTHKVHTHTHITNQTHKVCYRKHRTRSL